MPHRSFRLASHICEGATRQVSRRVCKPRQPVVDRSEHSDLRRERPAPPASPGNLQRFGEIPGVVRRQARHDRLATVVANPYSRPYPTGFDFGSFNVAEGDFRGAGPVCQPQSALIHRGGPGVPRAQDREQERRQSGPGDSEAGHRFRSVNGQLTNSVRWDFHGSSKIWLRVMRVGLFCRRTRSLQARQRNRYCGGRMSDTAMA